MARNLLDKALKYEVKGKFAEAARLYREANRFDKASFMFHKAGMHDESIEMLIKAGHILKAAEYCSKTEKFGKAAELFEEAKEYLKAAQSYIKNFQYKEAALMYEKAGRLPDAASLYLKTGNNLKAGKLYEKAGEKDNALHAYKMFINSGEIDNLQNSGQLDNVADIFLKAGEVKKAVELYQKAGKTEKAIEESIKASLFDEAVKIYKSQGSGIGYQLISRIPKDGSSTYVRFAQFFEKAGDHHLAGQIFENHDDFVAAGRAYRTSGDNEISAECFFRGEDYQSAAQMYELSSQFKTAGDLYYKLKDFQSAARNYEREGLLYRAGRLYQLIHQNEKAIELLQQLKPHDSDYAKAVRIITKALSDSGYSDLALEKYREIIPQTLLDADSVEFFYDYASTLAEQKEYDEAVKILKKIIGFQFGYKDATAKLKEIQALAENSQRKAVKTAEKTVQTDIPAEKEAEKSTEKHKPKEATPTSTPPDLLSDISAQTKLETVVTKEEAPSVPSPAPQKATVPEKAIKLLQNFPLFQGFDTDDLATVWNIGKTAVYEENEILFKEGDHNEKLFLLVTGEVALINRHGTELYRLNMAGAHFGELSLINKPPSRYGVKSLSKIRVIGFDSNSFLEFIKNNKKLSLLFFKSFTDSLSSRFQELPPVAITIKNDIEDIIKILPAVMV